MAVVLLVFVGLFLAGFCLVGLPRGVGQIVAGVALLVMSLTVAAVPPTSATPASEPPGHTFTLQLSRP
jgi:hypothetical protein